MMETYSSIYNFSDLESIAAMYSGSNVIAIILRLNSLVLMVDRPIAFILYSVLFHF